MHGHRYIKIASNYVNQHVADFDKFENITNANKEIDRSLKDPFFRRQSFTFTSRVGSNDL